MLEPAPETLYALSERHATERMKMIKEKQWRRAMLSMGFYVREVLGDLAERVASVPEENNEERDARRMAELQRIHQENVAHRWRLQHMRTTIDDDTEDDATGLERARARVASEARRREEAAVIAQQNAEQRERLRAIRSGALPTEYVYASRSAGANKRAVNWAGGANYSGLHDAHHGYNAHPYPQQHATYYEQQHQQHYYANAQQGVHPAYANPYAAHGSHSYGHAYYPQAYYAQGQQQ